MNANHLRTIIKIGEDSFTINPLTFISSDPEGNRIMEIGGITKEHWNGKEIVDEPNEDTVEILVIWPK